MKGLMAVFKKELADYPIRLRADMKGLMAVFEKELADHLTSWRFIILFAIVFAVGVIAIYFDAQYIRQEEVESHFVFLKLYTTSGQGVPLFMFFITFFLPIVGIILGFDAINSEKNSGTLSRLLSQPIYRDAVINGKFLAGVVTIAVMMTGLMLLVAGMGLRMIGVPPNSEEALRLMLFLIMTVVYGAFWLGLGILFSVFFQRVATSALASIALWLFFGFMGFIFIFPTLVPIGQTAWMVMQVSPVALFLQVTFLLLVPTSRSIGQLLQSGGLLPSSALTLSQSLISVWPHLVSIIVLTVVCFAISYIKFMREEIRST